MEMRGTCSSYTERCLKLPPYSDLACNYAPYSTATSSWRKSSYRRMWLDHTYRVSEGNDMSRTTLRESWNEEHRCQQDDPLSRKLIKLHVEYFVYHLQISERHVNTISYPNGQRFLEAAQQKSSDSWNLFASKETTSCLHFWNVFGGLRSVFAKEQLITWIDFQRTWLQARSKIHRLGNMGQALCFLSCAWNPLRRSHIHGIQARETFGATL